MRLFNGKKVADKILEDLKEKIRAKNLKPKLAVFLIGEDEASKIYIRLKKEAAEKIGVEFELHRYKISSSCHSRESGNLEILKQVQDDIVRKIQKLNRDESVSGIIVQLPLPEGFDRDKILSTINPLKDVDGFHIENRRLFEEGKPHFEPVLPTAILLAIKEAYLCRHPEPFDSAQGKLRGSGAKDLVTGVEILHFVQNDITKKILENEKAVALVNSDIFGRMLKLVLEKTGMDFKYLLQKACSLSGGKEELKSADIIITACGCPNLVRGEMIKQGAAVIDGGIYRYHDGRITGDVERKSVEERAEFLTPVPGGIGPLVIALLLKNVYMAAVWQK